MLYSYKNSRYNNVTCERFPVTSTPKAITTKLDYFAIFSKKMPRETDVIFIVAFAFSYCTNIIVRDGIGRLGMGNSSVKHDPRNCRTSKTIVAG